MTKIMVVDDQKMMRDMVNTMLKKEGYETETAENGEDFLNKIDNFQPELVTLDIMMPGLKTQEILEKLKEKRTKPKIILLTVIQFTDEQRDKLFKMGNVVGYITKPFDLHDLMDTVKNNL